MKASILQKMPSIQDDIYFALPHATRDEKRNESFQQILDHIEHHKVPYIAPINMLPAFALGSAVQKVTYQYWQWLVWVEDDVELCDDFVPTIQTLLEMNTSLPQAGLVALSQFGWKPNGEYGLYTIPKTSGLQCIAMHRTFVAKLNQHMGQAENEPIRIEGQINAIGRNYGYHFVAHHPAFARHRHELPRTVTALDPSKMQTLNFERRPTIIVG